MNANDRAAGIDTEHSADECLDYIDKVFGFRLAHAGKDSEFKERRLGREEKSVKD